MTDTHITTETIYPDTSTAAYWDITIGDILVAGIDGDHDCDMGEIIAISDDGESVTVAWEIGVCQTEHPLSDDVDIYEASARRAALRELERRRLTIGLTRGVTVTDIETLRDEAMSAGDYDMAEICGHALQGSINDRVEVCRVISDARREADA